MSAESLRDAGIEIEPLEAEQAKSLRVSWWSYFDQSGLAQHLSRYPGISFRVKGESQYGVGAYWRGRFEIGLILELVGSKGRLELVDRMIERFKELDCAGVVLSADETNRYPQWYLQQGWQVLDEIVIFTRRNCKLDGLPPPCITIEPFQSAAIDDLLALERTAFPFLWWSGREDFLGYAGTPDVRAFAFYLQGRMAGYVSFTLRNRQGYLDRIAVHPDAQRQGYGSQLLSFTLLELDKAGARSVSLNTQLDNFRAQSLYHKYGFVRTNSTERIYGRWLKDQEELDQQRFG